MLEIDSDCIIEGWGANSGREIVLCGNGKIGSCTRHGHKVALWLLLERAVKRWTLLCSSKDELEKNRGGESGRQVASVYEEVCLNTRARSHNHAESASEVGADNCPERYLGRCAF